MPRRPMSLGEALGGAVSRSGDRYQDYTNRKQVIDRQNALDSLDAAFRERGLEQGDRQIRGAEDRAALDREQFGHRQHMDFANLLAQSLEANKPDKPSTTSPVNSTEAAIARKWMSGEITEEQAVEMMRRFSAVEGSNSSEPKVPATLGRLRAQSFLDTRQASTPPAYTGQPVRDRDMPAWTPQANDSLTAAYHGLPYPTYNAGDSTQAGASNLTPEERQLLDQLRALEAQGQ